MVASLHYHTDGPVEMYVKQLIHRDAQQVILGQFNPVGHIAVPLRFVLALDRILTVNELFGRRP